jgi:multidrug efflux pump
MSTILGTLPITLALGAGSESRMSMGIAVVGGLIFSTGLTLYIIPAIYSYFSTAYIKPPHIDEEDNAVPAVKPRDEAQVPAYR